MGDNGEIEKTAFEQNRKRVIKHLFDFDMRLYWLSLKYKA